MVSAGASLKTDFYLIFTSLLLPVDKKYLFLLVDMKSRFS